MAPEPLPAVPPNWDFPEIIVFRIDDTRRGGDRVLVCESEGLAQVISPDSEVGCINDGVAAVITGNAEGWSFDSQVVEVKRVLAGGISHASPLHCCQTTRERHLPAVPDRK